MTLTAICTDSMAIHAHLIARSWTSVIASSRENASFILAPSPQLKFYPHHLELKS